MEFCSRHNSNKWSLTRVYAPCTPEGKNEFLYWLQDIQMNPKIDWMLLGDFNLIRKPEDRNRPGGDMNEMFRFNVAISQLGVNEIVLQGRKFTWSNMQPSPLLEKLDWIFTSNSWIVYYPDTSARGLDMIPSNHCPCVVNVSTKIPRSKIFRFENFWLKNSDYNNILNQSWESQQYTNDSAKLITAKLKNLRKYLKEWQASIHNLKETIANVRTIILFLEVISDYRDLSLSEWNFLKILETHLLELLEKQILYWRQSGNVKWVQLGDAGTHFFHANATIRHRGKLINELTSRNGTVVNNHKDKEDLLWQEFRDRMGISKFTGFTISPSTLM